MRGATTLSYGTGAGRPSVPLRSNSRAICSSTTSLIDIDFCSQY
jgi:hypothetical protein